MNRQPKQERRTAGFTLIELLVVIALITLLAALVSPLIRSSLALASGTQCKSNLRQLGAAMQLYSNNWELCILPAYYTPPSGSSSTSIEHAPGFMYWWHGVGRKGALWPDYANDRKVFVCPDTDATNPMASCSYTHNWAPWNGIPNVTPAQKRVQKVGDPQRTIIATESYNPVIWDWRREDGSGSLFHRLLDRHGSGNRKGPSCLYMDQHSDQRVRLELDLPDFTPINDHD